MKTLDKRGYTLRIPHWMGRLGNQILQLSGVINCAKATKSVVEYPENEFIRGAKFDFREPGPDNCNEVIVGSFFFQPDCFQFPIQYDRDRRMLFQEYLYEPILKKPFRERLKAALRPRTEITPETLVLNIRSGKDIFTAEPPPQNDYMQPPASFYKKVIEDRGHQDCLIVTEADQANPVIAELMRWNDRIRLKQHVSVRDDIETLLAARHLVTAHSTFSWCLALMSKQLKVLHQPATFQICGVTDFETNTYAFDNYIEVGEWTAKDDQLHLMVKHPVSSVRLLPKPESPELQLSGFG
jgi:hypothetical protein